MTTTAIPPGGEGEIKVTWRTGSKKGQQAKSITVTSSDPKNPKTTLRVTATVEVHFAFDHNSLYMGKIRKDESVTKTTYLLVKDLEHTKVVDIKTSSPLVTATVTDNVQKMNEYSKIQVEITLEPGLPIGRINQTVTLISNLDIKPEADLRITGIVAGDVEVTPEFLSFVVYDGSSSPYNLTKKVFITNNRADVPLEILDVNDAGDRLDLTLKPLDEGRRYELTATLKDDIQFKTGNNITGGIHIKTNNPEQKDIVVRYSAMRKSHPQMGKKSKRTTSAVLAGGEPVKGAEGFFESTGVDPFAEASAEKGKETKGEKQTLQGDQKGGSKNFLLKQKKEGDAGKEADEGKAGDEKTAEDEGKAEDEKATEDEKKAEDEKKQMIRQHG